MGKDHTRETLGLIEPVAKHQWPIMGMLSQVKIMEAKAALERTRTEMELLADACLFKGVCQSLVVNFDNSSVWQTKCPINSHDPKISQIVRRSVHFGMSRIIPIWLTHRDLLSLDYLLKFFC